MSEYGEVIIASSASADPELDGWTGSIAVAPNADPDAKGRTKTDLTSAKTVAATERLAKSDRRIAATVDQWDEDPDTFNTEAMP